MLVFGTRPEAIKMAPLVILLRKTLNVCVCVTAQHRQMLDQVLDAFEIKPDYDLNVMRPDQDLTELTSQIMTCVKTVIIKEQPDLILVHGDTSTAMATSLVAYYHQIPIGHVEAGLRTYNMHSPFPEEMNRQVISRIASVHFAPTAQARINLINEKILDTTIVVTGNTVIDALFGILNKARSTNFPDKVLRELPFLQNKIIPKIVLVTCHRRENFGSGFDRICRALKILAESFQSVHFVYPLHLNPRVRKPVLINLYGVKNIHLIEPLDYIPFIQLMDASTLILSDSGGIQEEAPSLGKPVLLLRDTTERPEAVIAGTVKLVGTNENTIVNLVSELLLNKNKYMEMATATNPYGDGKACEKILKKILEIF